MPTRLMILCCLFVCTGCAGRTPKPEPSPPTELPNTLGEKASGYGYIPLDGLAVREFSDTITCIGEDNGKKVAYARRPLLEALPDITVRFAVGELTGSGGLTFGPVKVTAEGGNYRAVLDYVNVDAVPVEFQVRKRVRTRGGDSTASLLGFFTVTDTSRLDVLDYEAIAHAEKMTETDRKRAQQNGYDILTIPVYIGVGMRLTAEIKARKGGIALTSLGAIAAEAQAGSLSGTLTVQTLGITGKAVATVLPLPSKLDQTTVENGILALGSSRTALYSSSGDDVVRTARVVGLYSPFGSDPRLIGAFYAAISQESPRLRRTCLAPNS